MFSTVSKAVYHLTCIVTNTTKRPRKSQFLYTGLRPVLAKYQFLPTNVLHGLITHYKTFFGKNWYLARTGHMLVHFMNIIMWKRKKWNRNQFQGKRWRIFLKNDWGIYNQVRLLNPFQNDKILDVTKLKALADDKLNIAKMISLIDRVENTVGKGENAGYQHFFLFPQCFPKQSFLGFFKVPDCMVKSKFFHNNSHFQVIHPSLNHDHNPSDAY